MNIEMNQNELTIDDNNNHCILFTSSIYEPHKDYAKLGAFFARDSQKSKSQPPTQPPISLQNHRKFWADCQKHTCFLFKDMGTKKCHMSILFLIWE